MQNGNVTNQKLKHQSNVGFQRVNVDLRLKCEIHTNINAYPILFRNVKRILTIKNRCENPCTSTQIEFIMPKLPWTE